MSLCKQAAFERLRIAFYSKTIKQISNITLLNSTKSCLLHCEMTARLYYFVNIVLCF